MLDGNVARVEAEVYVAAFALRQEHVEDLTRRVIAEELAEGFLVPPDSVALDEFEKVLRLVERERGLREVRVLGKEVLRSAMNVGEVAAASSGDEDLAAGLWIVFEKENSAIALPGDGGAHESGGTCAENDDVEFRNGGGHSCYCRRGSCGVCCGAGR